MTGSEGATPRPALPGAPPAEEIPSKPGRRWSLRGRLLAVIVGVTAVALTMSGAVALSLVRRSVRDATVEELERQVSDLTENLVPALEDLSTGTGRRPPLQRGVPDDGSEDFRGPNYRRLLGSALPQFLGTIVRTGDATVVLLGPDDTYAVARQPGREDEAIDAVIDPALLDVETLRSGGVASGTSGDVAYAASLLAFPGSVDVPVTETVIVLTAPVGTGIPGAGGPLLVAGLVALTVAVVVAVVFARWLTRPVTATSEAAARLAAGDFTARVPAASNDELGDLAQAFNELAEDLGAARDAERAFLMSVSHDLRTPLTSIKGYAERIADGGAEGEDAVRAAEVIGSESARLERLVADLLDLARLDAREFRLHYEDVQLGDDMVDLADAFASRAREAGLVFAVDPHPLPVVRTDPQRVQQVVANLVENALRYVPAGRSITVGWGPDDTSGWVDIWVADTGEGIAPEDLAHVFDRLYLARRYTRRRSVGTGLGLAIVRDLVVAMGGRVHVASRVDSGTRFTVQLPETPASGAGRT